MGIKLKLKQKLTLVLAIIITFLFLQPSTTFGMEVNFNDIIKF